VHVLSEHEVRRSCRAYVDVLPGARVVCSPVELPWPEVLGWCAEEGLVVAEPGLRGRGLRYRMSGDVPSTEACARDVVRAIVRLRRDHGVELDELAVVITADAPAAFDLTGLATRLRVAINGESSTHGITPPRLTVEPGRSLVVRAVVGVCRVRSVCCSAWPPSPCPGCCSRSPPSPRADRVRTALLGSAGGCRRRSQTGSATVGVAPAGVAGFAGERRGGVPGRRTQVRATRAWHRTGADQRFRALGGPR
jgi:hypothetical protein